MAVDVSPHCFGLELHIPGHVTQPRDVDWYYVGGQWLRTHQQAVNQSCASNTLSLTLITSIFPISDDLIFDASYSVIAFKITTQNTNFLASFVGSDNKSTYQASL